MSVKGNVTAAKCAVLAHSRQNLDDARHVLSGGGVQDLESAGVWSATALAENLPPLPLARKHPLPPECETPTHDMGYPEAAPFVQRGQNIASGYVYMAPYLNVIDFPAELVERLVVFARGHSSDIPNARLPRKGSSRVEMTLEQACTPLAGAMCVQRFDDSLNSAIHMYTVRGLLLAVLVWYDIDSHPTRRREAFMANAFRSRQVYANPPTLSLAVCLVSHWLRLLENYNYSSTSTRKGLWQTPMKRAVLEVVSL